MNTPWGVSQHTEKLAEGITTVSTSSHGGIKLDATRNAMVPDYMRNEDGWYEEDCDWAVPAMVFPFAFDYPTPEQAHSSARATLKNWKPDAYERYFSVTLQPEESYMRSERGKDFRRWLENGGRP